MLPDVDAIQLAMKRGPEGAEAAMTAQKRLQASTSTCQASEYGLAKISRDFKARSGDLIRVSIIKNALRALGHYDGGIDDILSPETREAISRFQSEREEDETGTLTPSQTTSLICSAAQTKGDLWSETTLGIMYTIGLGVDQNIDQAHYWLTEASRRGRPNEPLGRIYRSARRRSRGRVLRTQEVFGLHGPRHELAVETEPV